MRITYLHQYFNTPDMPGSTRSYEMARRLVGMGHEVTMITSSREGNRRAAFETEASGIRVHWLPVPYSGAMSYSARMRSFLRFAWAASRKAAELPTDVVFATSTPLTIAIPGVYAAKRRRVPMVLEVRDLWPEVPIAVGALRNPLLQKSAQRLERFAYRNAARVVALSPGMRDGVARTGYPKDRIVMIPNGADLDTFAPGSARDKSLPGGFPEVGEARLVVYAGTLGRINGVDYLARIAAAARKQGAALQFLVVGSGPQEAVVRDEAGRLGVLDRNFYMLPAIPKSKMPGVLARADIALSLFVNVAAMQANSANKFFDALASGTAVGINYGGWHEQLIRESNAGVVLPATESEEAARRLAAFAAHPTRMARAGRAARALAAERFSRDKLATQLEAVLQSAASRAS